MNHMPTLNRRAFVIGSAAVGSGLALGLDIPFGGPTVAHAADGSPEVNAWVVIRPDDTVVIRIARSEMGQGTLTGLAQLVAEELECDWSKVTTEYPTPGQSVARKRVWGDFSTGGSRGIRTSTDYVRKGGATARMMLIEAAANEWKVPASECTAANSVITHTPSGRKPRPTARSRKPPRSSTPPADVKLKDPKDWKIIGKGVKRLDTADKTTGKMTYGIDVKLPGMLNAAIKDCPVFGGKLKSFDEAKIAGMKGVKKVVKVGDNAVAVVADTWWHAKTALDALPIVWDEGDNAKVSSASIAKWLAEGLRPLAAGLCRQRERRRQGRARRRRQESRGGLQLSLPEPRHDGAAERHRALYRGQMRGLVRHAERRSRFRRDASRRPACRPTNATCTSRCSAAASAAAARPTTSGRRSRSPSRCRARRSSCCGRAKRTCSTARIIRSRSAS